MDFPFFSSFSRLGARHVKRAATIAVPLMVALPVTRAIVRGEETPERAELVNVPGRGTAFAGISFDSLHGRSGRLRARLLIPDEVDYYPSLVQRFGSGMKSPGIRLLDMPEGEADFAFITLKPWRDKLGSFINTYNVGWWPGERRAMPSNYDNPVGFIEVTKETANLRLSEHFTLSSFITRDQPNVWPKYVVLREELIDKLELVLATLEAQGIPTKNVVVLSGFRTPQYNARASFEGAAYASRHQYGDAADVIIDSDGNGRMDDLNRDGVVDFHDTDVINRAVERVEQRYPELVGGLGLYRAMGPSGPFAHIDVRGTRARWTNTQPARRPPARIASSRASGSATVGKCRAEGDMAALCARVR
jgi:uncharacterized protein YcbK (DUF882 family)